MPRQNEAPGTQFHTYLAFFSGPIICHWLDLDQHRCREADLCASNDSEGTNFAWREACGIVSVRGSNFASRFAGENRSAAGGAAITSNTALILPALKRR